MALIGQRNLLTIRREAAPGFYLDGGEHGEILLPGRYITKGLAPGGTVAVFVYRDSEDRLVATTEIPYAAVGEFAYLGVVSSSRIGAFLDWGLQKDLLLPMREQIAPIREGDWVIVRIHLDPETDRILASTRLDRWLGLHTPTYQEGEAVQLLVEAETPLGWHAIINHRDRGLLYRNELATSPAVGQPLKGYIKTIRPDGKIDLQLDEPGYARIAPLTQKILSALAANNGSLKLHDQSTPEEIRLAFGVSKKAFKQALGALYRKKKIGLESGGIRQLKE